MPESPDRAEARLQFVHRHCGDAARVEPASSDASFRSYWRVQGAAGGSRILMDAPPPQEDVRPWLDVARRLRAAGVHAPTVHAQDVELGFLLLEDLGERLYLAALTDATVGRLYGDALEALWRMQRGGATHGLSDYDETRLVAEMALMPTWFLHRHLGADPDGFDHKAIDDAFARLAGNALDQPQVFVHRDFHSRNLLVTGQDNPGVIDFQDAVRGPITYDLVSLLRDCYVAWPAQRVDAWVEQYRQRLVEGGATDADPRRFRRWFDLMGLQRHLKVLGIFCRLWYRDGKSGYLGDLPLVWRYCLDVMDQYPEFAELREQMAGAIGRRDLTRPASSPPQSPSP
ncbi:MAG: phosphotransferase [Xanthomonadales bacterium]|nr:phosphotransferase [Xanthomonadales bacterium]